MRLHKQAKTKRGTIRLVAVLLVLSGVRLSAAEQQRQAPSSTPNLGSQATNSELRFAQNTTPEAGSSLSPWEAIKAIGNSVDGGIPGSETLPTPQPNAPAAQHVIPFAKPDPDAEIVFEERDGLVTLIVRDGSLRQVIAMIAERQNLNIVFAAPADIAVTASLDKIPWQQALESLLSASGHTWANYDGIIFVSSLEMANLMSPGAGGRQTRIFELDFASAVDVDQTAKGLLSPGGQSWVLESSPTDNRRSREAIVAFDFPTHLQRIEDYICQVDQPPRQVLIEVNILQVELKDDCRNGVNFESIASFRGNELKFSTVGFANPAASSAFFLQATGPALDGLVEVLQTTADAKTLASPRLLVVSGQEARIQIGEKLGFRVTTTTQTSSLETIQFLDVGVVLSVQPRITRDGRILMRIKPEVSTGQIDPNTELPSEETTEVETDILLNDGQGMVIGGLIQEQDSIVQSKVPWLGDLPYLGLIFQKRQAIKLRTELIVTLIPHVQPYTPALAYRNSHELMRTQQPLTTGPLNLVSRPYEPRLYDSLTNPRPICVTQQDRCSPTPYYDPRLIPLPPMDEEPPCVPAFEHEDAEEITIPIQQVQHTRPVRR